MRELIARTVFWKLRPRPSRSVPRWTLSCFDGTQAGLAVRRHRGGAEVVRHAAALVLGVRLVAVAQDDRLLRRHGGRVDDDDLAAGRRAAAGRLHDGRALARLEWRDEARDVDAGCRRR